MQIINFYKKKKWASKHAQCVCLEASIFYKFYHKLVQRIIKLRFERYVTNIFLSGHPLFQFILSKDAKKGFCYWIVISIFITKFSYIES